MTTVAASLHERPSRTPRRVSVLGATGSVGTNTLDLIGRQPHGYKVVSLTANTDAKKLADCARAHNAEFAAIADQNYYGDLKELLSDTDIEVAAGPDAIVEAAARDADWIMAAIIGAAGLRPTFEAVRQGTHVALANKECLVSAGHVFIDAVEQSGTVLLPVDSEHSGAYQVIGHSGSDNIEKITLTASGGPFRQWSLSRIQNARPEDALKHPNWSMGRKITIDSATLMNKGLELIEAYYLFPVGKDQLDVVIHPQSIIHCLVEYADGSVVAQMSAPDMRTPIAYSLAYPGRMWAPTERLDFRTLKELSFEEPDENRFPALRIAREALQSGINATTILNAANEIAVEAFLRGDIAFTSICALVEATLEECEAIPKASDNLEDIIAVNQTGRRFAYSLLPRFKIA